VGGNSNRRNNLGYNPFFERASKGNVCREKNSKQRCQIKTNFDSTLYLWLSEEMASAGGGDFGSQMEQENN